MSPCSSARNKAHWTDIGAKDPGSWSPDRGQHLPGGCDGACAPSLPRWRGERGALGDDPREHATAGEQLRGLHGADLRCAHRGDPPAGALREVHATGDRPLRRQHVRLHRGEGSRRGRSGAGRDLHGHRLRRLRRCHRRAGEDRRPRDRRRQRHHVRLLRLRSLNGGVRTGTRTSSSPSRPAASRSSASSARTSPRTRASTGR